DDRRGGHRRGTLHAAYVLERLVDELRHRDGETADLGQSRLLRTVRARADRVDPSHGPGPWGGAPPARGGRPRAPRERVRGGPPARPRRSARTDRDRGGAAGPPPAHARGPGPRRTLPSLLHGMPRGLRR